MSKRVLAVILAILAAPSVWAECDIPLDNFAKETLTISTVSLALTASKYAPGGTDQSANAVAAVVTTENDSVRFWACPGCTPTSSEGHLISPGTPFTICSAKELKDFRAIRAASTDVPLQISYYRKAR